MKYKYKYDIILNGATQTRVGILNTNWLKK